MKIEYSQDQMKRNDVKKHGKDIDEKNVRLMMGRLSDVAKSPPAMFASMESYEKKQKALAEEARERFKHLPKDGHPSFLGGNSEADDIRNNLMRLFMSSMDGQRTESRAGERSMLASLFGARPSERVSDRLARTEEMLVLRAMQLSLEEARERERESSKGRCDSELGIEDSDDEDAATIEAVKRMSLREAEASASNTSGISSEDARIAKSDRVRREHDENSTAESVAAPPMSD